MSRNLNVVVLSGNLTRDPELKATPNGAAVCSMRLAVNERAKDRAGEWVDRANYFDLVAFGSQAEAASSWLRRGSHVEVSGRLRWREWETQDGSKRQAVEVVADVIGFPPRAADAPPAESSAPARSTSPSAGCDDDIPF